MVQVYVLAMNHRAVHASFLGEPSRRPLGGAITDRSRAGPPSFGERLNYKESHACALIYSKVNDGGSVSIEHPQHRHNALLT